MSRFSFKQYQRQVLIAMSIYLALLLFAWPQVHATASLPLKVLLAIAPTLPVIYVIGQLARLIRSSDELERHTHLLALSTATAVVSALSFIAGFLSIAGVVTLDGSVLTLVFPAVVLCYGLVRWRLVRSYGGDAMCADEGLAKPWLYFVVLGIVMILIALLFPTRFGDRASFLCGVGGGLIVAGVSFAVLHWYRRKVRHD